MKWVSLPNFMTAARVGGEQISVTVMQAPDGHVHAVAVSTPWRNARDMDKVLEHHAHENLGMFDSIDEAKAAGELFIKRRRRRAKRCECTTIDDALATTRRKR